MKTNKQYNRIAFILTAFILTAFSLFSQDTKPTGANFKPLQSPSFNYFTTDSSVWVYKNATYGWTQLARVAKKYSIWNHTGISNTGWATGKLLGFNSSGNLVPLSGTGGSGIALTDLSASSPVSYNNTTGVFSMISNAYAPYGTVSMVYPSGSGIPIISTGSSWGTTITAGTSAQYLKGDFTKGTFPTALSSFTNDLGNYGSWITGNQSITLSGDVSGTGTTAITTAIGSNKVTLGMMSQMATSSFLGRNTAATGNVEVLSVATAKSMLGLGSAAYTPSTDYATSSHNLGSHSDVVISSPTTGEYFGYQGGSWGNHPLLIGSTSGLPIITTTSGTLSAGSFSNTAGTFAEGNHTHSIYAALAGSTSQNFNVATLGIEAGSNDWSVSGSAGVLNFTSYSASIAFGATGNITASNFTLSSDRRLKQNIRPITFSNSNQIRFVNYEMKADSTHRTRYGVIAQDIERIMPEAVYTDEKGIKSVDYTAILIAKISELENRIKTLENEK